jgi:hypothetical protein
MAELPRVPPICSSFVAVCTRLPERATARRAGVAALGMVVLVLAWTAPATARAGSAHPAHSSLGASSTRIHLLDLPTAWRLRQAIDGAREWLAEPDCLAVFSDLEDLSGKPLS